MPAAFDRCVKRGGRVRTKKFKDGSIQKFCFIDGKSFAGHKERPKKGKKRKGK